MDAMGGLFPVSMSISISSVFPMSPLLLEIILSNQLHRSWNLPLVSSLIWASFKSTFLCVSTSAGDLIKFVAVVRPFGDRFLLRWGRTGQMFAVIARAPNSLVLYPGCQFQILSRQCCLSLQRLRRVSLVGTNVLCF